MSNIRVELQLEDGSFTTGIWRAGRSLAEFKDELRKTSPHFNKLASAGRDSFLSLERHSDATEGFGRRLRNASVVMGGAVMAFHALSGASNSLIGNIIRANAEMEKLKFQMAGMSEAADSAAQMREAGEAVEYVRAMANSAPFALGALSNSFVKLKAAGIDPMNGSLRALVDGLAAFGASDEQLNRVTVAITQMQGKGVISMEELRQQLGESMPTAMRLMARSMGVSVGELTKLVATGTVESKAAIDKWLEEVRLSYGGTGDMMMQTFSGQMAKIRTAFVTLATTGNMGAAFDKLKVAMGDFAKFLDTQRAKDFFDMMAAGFSTTIDALEIVGSALNASFEAFQNWSGLLKYVFGGMAVMGGFRLMGTAIQSVRMSYTALTSSVSGVGRAVGDLGAAISLTSQAARGALLSTAATATATATAVRTQQTAVAAGMTAMAGGTLLRTAVAVGSRFLGLLGPIGLGLSIVAPFVWDIAKGFMGWADSAEDAANASRSASEAALHAAEAEHENLMARLRNQYERARNRYEDAFARGHQNDGMLREMAALNDRMEREQAAHNERMQGLREDDAERQVGLIRDEIREELREAGRDYDRAMNEIDRRANQRIASAATSGESARVIADDRRRETIEAQRIRYQAEIDAYTAQIERRREAHADDHANNAILADLIEDREKLVERMTNLRPEGLTVELLTAPESDEKRMERLGKRIERERERVAELQAELHGASGAVGRLMYQIRRGDFGNFRDGSRELERMRDLLIETTIQAEALDLITKGSEETTGSLDRIIENLEKERLRMQAEMQGVDTNNELAYHLWLRANGALPGAEGTAEEIVRRAIDTVSQGVNTAVGTFETLAQELRGNAFSNASVNAINNVDSALQRVRGTVTGISQGLSGLDFSVANPASLGAMGMIPRGENVPVVNRASGNALLDLIASVESAGDYNATLDNGEWTNGPQNLIGMTLREVRQLQEYMLSQEGNRARHGDGVYRGSSALGRYQITGRTLDSLMATHGLSGNELFDERMQDFLATQLVRGRGRDVQGLGREWVGLQRVNGQQILNAYDSSMVGPRASNLITPPPSSYRRGDTPLPPAAVAAAQAGLDGINQRESRAVALDTEVAALRPQHALDQMVREMTAALGALNREGRIGDDAGTNERRFLERLLANDFAGVAQDQIDAARAQAVALDAAQRDRQERQRDHRAVSEAEKDHQRELTTLNERYMELLRQASDPNSPERSSALAKLEESNRELLEAAERLYGRESAQYQAVLGRTRERTSAQVQVDAAEALVQLSSQRRDLELNAVEDERQRRQQAFEEELRQLAALRDTAMMDAANVAQVQQAYDAAVAAARQRHAQENRTELGEQIRIMSDYARNINANSAQWTQQLGDALYGAASGDGEALRNFGLAVRESIARSLTDAAAAAIMKPLESIIGGNGDPNSGIGGLFKKGIDALTGGDTFKSIFSGLGAMFKSMFGGLGGMFGKKSTAVMHTGGIVGRSGGWSRPSSVSNFIGAPKYHTGGIVGGPAFRKGLLPSEVPVIAQKGEGIFTKDQMAHLGGSVNTNAITIAPAITVNASGGTPEANQDLARQVARESENMIRGIVQTELVRQMRPGGIMR